MNMASNSDGTDSDINTGNLYENIRCEYTKGYSSTFDSSSDSDSRARYHSDCDGVSVLRDEILLRGMSGRRMEPNNKDSESDVKPQPPVDCDQRGLFQIIMDMQRQIMDVKASVDSLREEVRVNHEQIMKQLVRIEGSNEESVKRPRSRRPSLQVTRISPEDTSIDSQILTTHLLQVPLHGHDVHRKRSPGGSETDD
ncbi:uncharacterized protein LOC124270145 isoform X1 [Haliotis rubra]|uniref:uncharacterized protein LOC124270145 isoform X1 n=1 Tax=Haliotis rubra TaxID=36100 RepID=UPI001EE55C36|nr:uncharacterized protein LOC124270145 isoform X1 [Haliotis rubra]